MIGRRLLRICLPSRWSWTTLLPTSYSVRLPLLMVAAHSMIIVMQQRLFLHSLSAPTLQSELSHITLMADRLTSNGWCLASI